MEETAVVSTIASAAPTSIPASAPVSAPTPASPIDMKSPAASTMLADLDRLALDQNHLPPIEKLDPRSLRGVMKLIAKSLGARCGDCHQEGDFAAPTPRKKLAAKMWDEFVVKLALADGAPLFCDSCHHGRAKQLNRADKKALSKWMDENFVDKLKRRDGRDHDCETCHVNMDMRFLNKWAEGLGRPE
jgi:hypothetical protein